MGYIYFFFYLSFSLSLSLSLSLYLVKPRGVSSSVSFALSWMVRVMNGVITRMESGDKSQLVKTNADERTRRISSLCVNASVTLACGLDVDIICICIGSYYDLRATFKLFVFLSLSLSPSDISAI